MDGNGRWERECNRWLLMSADVNSCPIPNPRVSAVHKCGPQLKKCVYGCALNIWCVDEYRRLHLAARGNECRRWWQNRPVRRCRYVTRCLQARRRKESQLTRKETRTKTNYHGGMGENQKRESKNQTENHFRAANFTVHHASDLKHPHHWSVGRTQKRKVKSKPGSPWFPTARREPLLCQTLRQPSPPAPSQLDRHREHRLRSNCNMAAASRPE